MLQRNGDSAHDLLQWRGAHLHLSALSSLWWWRGGAKGPQTTRRLACFASSMYTSGIQMTYGVALKKPTMCLGNLFFETAFGHFVSRRHCSSLYLSPDCLLGSPPKGLSPQHLCPLHFDNICVLVVRLIKVLIATRTKLGRCCWRQEW